MENKVPKIILHANHRQTRPGVWLMIVGVLLLFINQNVSAQTVCQDPISYTLIGTDATSATANDARIRISGNISGNNKVGYSVGETYTGPDFASATKISDLDSAYISKTLPTPTNPAGTKYTIRVFSVDGSCYTDKVFTLEYVNFNTVPVHPDIQVAVGSDKSSSVPLNTTVTITVQVTNVGNGAATGVKLKIGIPAGFTYLSGTASTGTFATSDSVWTIGNVPNGGAPITFTLTGKITARGVKYITANVTGENEQDLDSSPTTNIQGEDDYGTACVSTPFDYCMNDIYVVTLPRYTGIKWYRNDTLITASMQGVIINSDSSLSILKPGVYSYTTNIGLSTCSSNGCCPIYVEPGTPPLLVDQDPQSICKNATFAAITIQNTQTNPNGTYIYQWYNDNGANNASTAAIDGQNTSSFTAFPTAVGVYKYKLRVYEQGHENCADSTIVTLTIRDLPVVAMTEVKPVCAESTISLKADGAGDGGSYAWTGPANFTANVAAPTRPNAEEAFEGSYVVTVTNGVACSATATVSVVINDLPKPLVTTPKVFCREDSAASIAGTAIAEAGHHLLWYGTDQTGGDSTRVIPIHNPTEAKTTLYYVSQVSESTGCESHRSSVEVKVNEKPNAPVVNTPLSACEDSAPITLQPNETATAGVTYLWYSGAVGGTASTTATVASTDTVGTKTYYVSKKIDATTCESNRSAIVVEIRETPVAVVQTVAPVCAESTIVLKADGAGSGGSYAWTGPANFTASVASPTRPNAEEAFEGNYVVTVTNGVACSASASVAVTINPLPAAPALATTPKVFCREDSSTSIEGAAIALAGHHLLWYGTSETGGDSTLAATPFSATSAGVTTYYVSQLNEANGCISHRTPVTITVNEKPKKPVAEDKVYCQSIPADVLTATGDAQNTIKWYENPKGGNAIAAPTPPTNEVKTLYYYATQTNSFGCESDRDTSTVKINRTPDMLVVNPLKYCQGATPNALSATGEVGNTIVWYANGGTSLTAPAVLTNTPGLTYFSVTQIIPGTGCESPMATVSVTIDPKPVAEVIAVNSICIGTVSQNNAQLILTRYRNSDEVSYNSGGTYNATTPSAFASVPNGGVFASNLANPSSEKQSYTVRIKNSYGCTIDRVPVLTQTNCACPGGYCEPASIERKAK